MEVSETYQVLRAELDGVIWLVFVVIAIISQMVKAARDKKERPGAPVPTRDSPQGPTRPPANPPAMTEAQAELQDFLRDLAGTASVSLESLEPEPAPATTRAPVDLRTPPPLPAEVKPATLAASPPQPVPRAPRISTAQSRTRPARAFEREISNASTGPEPRHLHVESLRLALGADLITPHALQKAILLQEVLGKPLSLRTTPTGQPT